MSDFDEIFGSQQSHLPLFAQNCFPAIFMVIFNFCVKRKNAFISEMVRDCDFDKIFDPQSIPRVMWQFCPKIVFPPFW